MPFANALGRAWADTSGNGDPQGLPAGEQFAELREWLENGLTRLEIEAVKARHKSDVRRAAKEAIERLAKTDESELKALLGRYRD